MKRMKRLAIVAVLAALITVSGAYAAGRPLVQVALLLDTSNSMDGLIDQARSQLWKIVNEFAAARRDGRAPELLVALYEYGNNSLGARGGYIRCVVPLSGDLDRISDELFRLRTNGGDEYCGQVIGSALAELNWSADKNDLKLIFIAGNEPFTQGGVNYKESCRRAVERGIAVSTIFCGSAQEGISGGWKDGADRGEGRYFSIDADRKVVVPAAPQDDEIARLSRELNTTYVAYGGAGEERKQLQARQENLAGGAGTETVAQRAVAKASSQYRNSGWDLVDADKEGKVKVEEMKADELPAEMRAMSPAERKRYVAEKSRKRAEIQKRIQQLGRERRDWLDKQAPAAGNDTLEAAIIQAVRELAMHRGFVFAAASAR